MTRKVYDKDSEAFYCCCGCMHVKTGTIVVCIIQLLYFILCTVISCWAENFALGLGAIVILVLFSLLMLSIYVTPIIGIFTKAAGWLWPYVIVSIINLVLSFGLLITTLIGLCLNPHGRNSIIAVNSYDFENLDGELIHKWSNDYYWLSFFLVKHLASAVFGSWFLMVVWSCKSYLRDFENDRIASSSKMTTVDNVEDQKSKVQGSTVDNVEDQKSKVQGTTDVQTEEEKEKKKVAKKDKDKSKKKEKEKDKTKKDKKKKKAKKDSGEE